MVSKVYMICNAYESGIGHGLKQDGVRNPYATGSDEREAWGIGYQEGDDRANSERREQDARRRQRQSPDLPANA